MELATDVADGSSTTAVAPTPTAGAPTMAADGGRDVAFKATDKEVDKEEG